MSTLLKHYLTTDKTTAVKKYLQKVENNNLKFYSMTF